MTAMADVHEHTRSPRRAVSRGLARSETPRAVSLDEAVRAFVRANGLSAKHGHFQVYQAWARAVGRDMARRARGVRFARNELTVEVDSAALMAELAGFTGEKHRQKANQLLGGETIRKVRFQGRR